MDSLEQVGVVWDDQQDGERTQAVQRRYVARAGRRHGAVDGLFAQLASAAPTPSRSTNTRSSLRRVGRSVKV